MLKNGRRLFQSLLDRVGGEGGGRRYSTSLSPFPKVGKRPRSRFLMGSLEGPVL
jgi:hypothetical protein